MIKIFEVFINKLIKNLSSFLMIIILKTYKICLNLWSFLNRFYIVDDYKFRWFSKYSDLFKLKIKKKGQFCNYSTKVPLKRKDRLDTDRMGHDPNNKKLIEFIRKYYKLIFKEKKKPALIVKEDKNQKKKKNNYNILFFILRFKRYPYPFKHAFHLVKPSIWPFLVAIVLLVNAILMVVVFNMGSNETYMNFILDPVFIFSYTLWPVLFITVFTINSVFLLYIIHPLVFIFCKLPSIYYSYLGFNNVFEYFVIHDIMFKSIHNIFFKISHYMEYKMLYTIKLIFEKPFLILILEIKQFSFVFFRVWYYIIWSIVFTLLNFCKGRDLALYFMIRWVIKGIVIFCIHFPLLFESILNNIFYLLLFLFKNVFGFVIVFKFIFYFINLNVHIFIEFIAYLLYNPLSIIKYPMFSLMYLFEVKKSLIKTTPLGIFYISFFIFLALIYMWFNNIIKEGVDLGEHTTDVQRGIKYGFALFIISEIFLFFSFFWAAWYLPSQEMSACDFIPKLKFWSLPLFNTIVLVLSSITLHVTDYIYKSLKIELDNIVKDKNKDILLEIFQNKSNNKNLQDYYKIVTISLIVTILLGLIFLICQIIEYHKTPFSINDGAYPTYFFMLTGLHGTHVFIGLCLLIVSLFRHLRMHFNGKNFTGLKLAIWYWHFVDIVWLIVFGYIYIYKYFF